MQYKKTKLIFINVLPLSRILGTKLDSKWFHENGFDVECWDCSPLFWSKEKLNSYFSGIVDYKNIGPNQQTIDTKELLESKIATLNANTIVFHINRGFYRPVNDDWIFEKIQQTNAKLILYTLILPVDKGLNKLLRPLRNLKYNWINRKIKPDGFVGSGSKVRKFTKWMYPDSKFISVPTLNATWSNSEKLVNHKYNLFIDENVRYNPDAEMRGLTLCDDVDGYYRRMNNLFDRIEEYTKTPIVIAASGKYFYKEDHFNGRQVIYSKTFDLVVDADIVIAHASSALSQAIINKKPLLIVDDVSFSEFRKSWYVGVKAKTNKSPTINEEITKEVFFKNITIDSEYFDKVIDIYFKEKKVLDSYQTVVKNALLELVNK